MLYTLVLTFHFQVKFYGRTAINYLKENVVINNTNNNTYATIFAFLKPRKVQTHSISTLNLTILGVPLFSSGG